MSFDQPRETNIEVAYETYIWHVFMCLFLEKRHHLELQVLLIVSWLVTMQTFDSSLAAAVAMAPSDSGFNPLQRRHLINAQLVSQLIRVQLVLLD